MYAIGNMTSGLNSLTTPTKLFIIPTQPHVHTHKLFIPTILTTPTIVIFIHIPTAVVTTIIYRKIGKKKVEDQKHTRSRDLKT